MRISIITIFKNEERFLAEAAESVFKQTYPSWEYFLVDDGSDDGSTLLAQRLARKRPNVHYLQHPRHANRGMSASRNLALVAAAGELIGLIDADDLWEPDKLSQQVSAFEKNAQLAMIFGAPLYWYSWTGRSEDKSRDHLQELGAQPGQIFEPPSLISRFLRQSAATPCTCDLMVRRSVAQAVGGFANEFSGLYEDQVFCVKVGMTYSIAVGPSGLSRYRRRSDSHCARAFRAGKHARARRDFLKWVKRYMDQNRFYNDEIQLIVNDELRQARREVLREWPRQVRRVSNMLGDAG